MQPSALPSDQELQAIREQREPDIQGRSKRLWLLPDGLCMVEMIPSLRSFTYSRDELVEETGPLRLDFYERAAARLEKAGIRTAFVRRLGPVSYLAEYHPAPPFEVIVKNRAVGSTLVKYPGLFEEYEPLPRPVVKFDYRVDPEDQPIGEDYLRALDLPVDEFRRLALGVNASLIEWLDSVQVWDFCVIFGLDGGQPVLISEISPDCMRLRHADGSSLDKDLFRRGASAEEITTAWRRLLDELA
ncbi:MULTISPECIES: phosphoribosylaminoimidazolesuccinocarboxamide synthase [Kitasatospora]|uniref:phosphoribosylaminoimidazolesuccinocarboxamide synthase n=1 Tax=Kitasatospora TaxID=2063 RepID=UPI000C278640|nr:phosphoribosylaminoimidazolesuccinocarboxamide synthase [Kitasatospora sp. CB02891]PJN24021.1 SAICAR synthetase [Kitasatospora sp. CB02891]